MRGVVQGTGLAWSVATVLTWAKKVKAAGGINMS